MSDFTPASQYVSVNPFTLPEEQHGWRGLSVPGNHKRKWYTLLHNEFCFVTAFIALPGERPIRHTHETGELNISYAGENRPMMHWNPPGVPHGGVNMTPPGMDDLDARVRSALGRVNEKDPDIGQLLDTILQRQTDLGQVLEALSRPQPGLRIAIDVLFPPFKTTIDDPLYPEKKTVIGQWYD